MAAVASGAAVPGNLPLQLTSFVGRDAELATLARLLENTRLLTLTGTGGSGKTRLALELATAVAGRFTDGVWLVELAPLADPALIPRTVAAALDVHDVSGDHLVDSLVEHLRGRSLLLVLDNCEHLIAAAAELAETLLRACPGLVILATSREPLAVAGETTFRVPPLALPEMGQVPFDADLLKFEAVRLFVERGAASLPGFAPGERELAAVVEVCRRLDGMPLALELAAARLRVFSVEQIAARLDDRFRLLTGGPRTALPRQQSLRAAVDWSYVLLAEPERALLRRLSVFSGGWSFEAAEVVGAADHVESDAVLGLLTQLVEKSLVIVEPQRGAVRYRLHETIRQYALDQLRAAGEEAETRERHLAYFLALAEAAEPQLRGADYRRFLDTLEDEHANLRAALEWALDPTREDDAALRLSGALAWFWWLHSYVAEGQRWLARALALRPGSNAARMKALYCAGYLAHYQRDPHVAGQLLHESLALARDLGDRWAESWVLHLLGRVAYFDDDPITARLRGEESLVLAEQLGDDWLIAWALHLLGLAAYISADYATARDYYRRGLEIRRELGYDEGIGILLLLLAVVALRERDLAEAATLLREGLGKARSVMGTQGMAMPLAALASMAAAVGQPARAVRLGGAVAAICDLYRAPMLVPLFEPLLQDALEIARRELDQDTYAAAWDAGRTLPLEASIADALAIELQPSGERRPVPFGELTPAELQVLRLLATGRTTREIAGELFVAVSTVERHLTHVYTKLGVRNRAEATAFALRHGLS